MQASPLAANTATEESAIFRFHGIRAGKMLPRNLIHHLAGPPTPER
jgi:hypothetical protein